MEYRLADFYDTELEEPTERLVELVREAVFAYEQATDIPLSRVYLVGSIIAEDTSDEGRKDVDLWFEPADDMDEDEREDLYFRITNHLQQTFHERYEAFVAPLNPALAHLDLTGYFL